MQIVRNRPKYLTRSAEPTLIQDVELMRHLGNHRTIPKNGLHVDVPVEYFAKILYAAYTNEILNRGKEMILTPELEKNIWAISRYLTTPNYRLGIFLAGPVGNGKTTMLHAIRETFYFLAETDRKVVEHTGIFNGCPIITAKEICKEYIATACTYLHRDFLMIDDIGHEATEWNDYGSIKTPIIDFIEMRYARLKYMFASSNLSTQDIGRKYGQRISDRLDDMMFLIDFTDDSFRE